jgi:hypothetical protein
MNDGPLYSPKGMYMCEPNPTDRNEPWSIWDMDRLFDMDAEQFTVSTREAALELMIRLEQRREAPSANAPQPKLIPAPKRAPKNKRTL